LLSGTRTTEAQNQEPITNASASSLADTVSTSGPELLAICVRSRDFQSCPGRRFVDWRFTRHSTLGHCAGQEQGQGGAPDRQVDVLTLSPIFLPDPGIENFTKLALEHNPDIRVIVQPFGCVGTFTSRPPNGRPKSTTTPSPAKNCASAMRCISRKWTSTSANSISVSADRVVCGPAPRR